MIRAILLFGGRSAEHEVSILSARSVAAAAAADRVALTPICIARDGRFIGPERSGAILGGDDRSTGGEDGFSFETWVRTQEVDVVFPLIHGTGGEDGVLQGYLEMLGLPYVGSGVAASAVAMDKPMAKRMFAAAGIPVAEERIVTRAEAEHIAAKARTLSWRRELKPDKGPGKT